MKRILFALIVLMLAGCSDDGLDIKSLPKGAGPGQRQPQKQEAPAQEAVADLDERPVDLPLQTMGTVMANINPVNLHFGDMVTLSTRGVDINLLTEADVIWTLDGSPVSVEDHLKFDTIANQAVKGSYVQAIVTYNGDEIASNVLKVLNSVPELNNIKLPNTFGVGQGIRVEMDVADRDGDSVTVEYLWTKNGVPISRSAEFETPVVRGDRFTLRLVAFDGEDYTEPILIEREIGNIPPVIQDDLNHFFEKDVYKYQIKASDVDEDKLTYKIESAPEGMTVDAATGLVTWTVPKDFLGTAKFVVVAEDGHGGRATMERSVILESE